jgi:hypothetical protein
MLAGSVWSRSSASLVVIATLALRAADAHADAAISGTHCRVTLSKLSYDDPGTDDAEFIELRVDRTVPVPGLAARDAGADAAPAASADAAVTLGACGLAALELVDGQGGACSVYRTIPVADLQVPDDDVVVLCSAGTAFAASCDVTTAGPSALKNGWLQNGPSDGVRLRGTSGAAVEIGYDPPPACFGAAALRVPDESGEVAGPGVVDDVATLCDGTFVLLSAVDAPLRAPPRCPRTSSTGGTSGELDAAADSAPVRERPPAESGVAVDASSPQEGGYLPERAPTPRESPSKDDPLFRTDAGVRAPPDLRPVPRPPGCALRRLPLQKAKGAPAWTLLLLLARSRGLRRRRRPPVRLRGPLRAGSSAHCGFAPPRSPSR